MFKKRYLVAGALSATLTACGADIHAPPGGSGATANSAGGTGGPAGGSAGATAGGSSNTGGTSNGTGGNSSGAGGTGAGGSGGTGTGGSAGYSGGGGADTTCTPGIPATSQIPRMKDAAYDAVIHDLLGVTTLATANNVAPSALLSPDSGGSLDAIGWNGYQEAAQTIAAEVIGGANKSKFISCDGSSADCLTTTLKAFGRKAFRRPLTDTEVTSFMRLNSLTPKGTPDQVAQAMLTAILESPSFILLPELGQTQDPSGALQLTSYEIATRLSFMLWGSIPDDMLNQAADAGMLTSKDQILTQAKRMLADARATAGFASFLHYYAGIAAGSHWVNVQTHDPKLYPTFTDASYAPAMSELDSFYQDIVQNGGSFKDLFLSPNAFVNKDTAAIYGLDPTKFGTDLTKVALDANQRPGFLTRAGFLSTFSKFDTTSPILRGAFIITKILGIPLGQPPPGAINTPVPDGNYTTMRQEIDALTAAQKCQSCHHTYINPAGYVLEHFNSVGTWQDNDILGGPIDSSGSVIVSSDPNATPQAMSSALDLMKAIAASQEAKFVYARELVAYASNRVPNENDNCVAQTLSNNMAGDAYPLVNLVADYTQADSFRLRTVGN